MSESSKRICPGCMDSHCMHADWCVRIDVALIDRAKKVVAERRDIIAKVGNHSWEWDGHEMWEICCLLAGTEAK